MTTETVIPHREAQEIEDVIEAVERNQRLVVCIRVDTQVSRQYVIRLSRSLDEAARKHGVGVLM